ncbi:MAG: hypothetical protein RL885_06930 [Planctomycetota bacterium]
MNPIHSRGWLALLVLLASAGQVDAQKRLPSADRSSPDFLDNGVIRIGVDVSKGGAIRWLSRSGSTDNVINVADLGRYVQQSYYSGPCPYVPEGASQHPAWSGWCWNPIQVGDVFGNPSRLLDHTNDGQTLYTQCVPMQWALDGVPGDCTLETWIRLEENRAHVRCRLVNARQDPARYPAAHQELPAIYTIGRLHRLFTYTGLAPFTGDALTQIQNSGPPWEYWLSTERWAALVDDDGWGVGIVHPDRLLTAGGFHGTPGVGGPADGATGYIAPLHTEVIDAQITYEYAFILILGTLSQIRELATANAPEARPRFRFHRDRSHWIPINARDAAPPYDGAWTLSLEDGDPQLISPPMDYEAARAPKLTIEAAYRGAGSKAELFFARTGEDFSAARRVEWPVISDGVVRTYVVDLAAHSDYTGRIGKLRFDPLVQTQAGNEIDLVSIGFE